MRYANPHEKQAVLDKVFVTLCREPYLLLQAVAQYGVKLDILLQRRRNKVLAKRFFQARSCRLSRGTAQDRNRSVAQLSCGKGRDPGSDPLQA
jgi:transposase-like protein